MKWMKMGIQWFYEAELAGAHLTKFETRFDNAKGSETEQ